MRRKSAVAGGNSKRKFKVIHVNRRYSTTNVTLESEEETEEDESL